jgi:predicted aspartyl protease
MKTAKKDGTNMGRTGMQRQRLLGWSLVGLLGSGLMGCEMPLKLGASPSSSAAQPTAQPTAKPKPGESKAAREISAQLEAESKKPGAKPPKAAAQEANSDGELYRSALDKADSARSLSQSAQGPVDWSLVVTRWKQAIEALGQIPKSDPNHKYVGGKLSEFKQGMAIAQEKAKGRQVQGELERGIYSDESNNANKPVLSPADDNRTFQARIKYRQSRIPIIDVVFNGKQTYEMMLDTGASGTMITPEMAQKLGVRLEGSVNVTTASGQDVQDVGYINSITVGSKTLYRVPVTIGPANLLGHDFFGSCDLTIRKDVVEFEKCSG